VKHLVAGLDVGSDTTAAVIATLEDGPSEGVTILGVGSTKTKGIRGDVLTDMGALTESIRRAMAEAEIMAGHRVRSVQVGLGGSHIESRSSLGVVSIDNGEVTKDDVERCHAVARAIVLAPDREMLHVVPQEYRVDDRGGIFRPVGMRGIRLECDSYVITCSNGVAEDIRRSVARSGLALDGLVLEPLASARSVLTDDEREIGVAVADIGHAATSVAVFQAGRLEHVFVFPFGGAALTTDLVSGLAVSYAEAQRAKERYGTAIARMVDPHETIDMPGPSPGQTRPVARELISHIVEQRFAEILGHLRDEIELAAPLEDLAAGVVLTGGTASMPGTVELAEETFACSVRVGLPEEGLGDLAEGVARPRYAVVTGLALWAGDVHRKNLERLGTTSIPARIAAWFRDFF